MDDYICLLQFFVVVCVCVKFLVPRCLIFTVLLAVSILSVWCCCCVFVYVFVCVCVCVFVSVCACVGGCPCACMRV